MKGMYLTFKLKSSKHSLKKKISISMSWKSNRSSSRNRWLCFKKEYYWRKRTLLSWIFLLLKQTKRSSSREYQNMKMKWYFKKMMNSSSIRISPRNHLWSISYLMSLKKLSIYSNQRRKHLEVSFNHIQLNQSPLIILEHRQMKV